MAGQRDENGIARLRAIALVDANFGRLNDLSDEVAHVVWVSCVRACEVAVAVEEAGGAAALVKDMLVGGRKLTPALREETIKIDFLKKMIPIIRNQSNPNARSADSQILIDCLKWNIIDAGEMSTVRRAIARTFAKADRLYAEPVPKELLI